MLTLLGGYEESSYLDDSPSEKLKFKKILHTLLDKPYRHKNSLRILLHRLFFSRSLVKNDVALLTYDTALIIDNISCIA